MQGVCQTLPNDSAELPPCRCATSHVNAQLLSSLLISGVFTCKCIYYARRFVNLSMVHIAFYSNRRCGNTCYRREPLLAASSLESDRHSHSTWHQVHRLL